MPRPKTTGLKSVRKKRPDGSVLYYHYDKQTGKFLSHDRDTALAMLAPAPSLVPELSANSNTLAALVALYYSTDKFKKRSPRTQGLYRHNLNQILAKWGRVPVRGFKPGDFEKLKIDLQDTPYKANNFLRILRVVFKLGVKVQWIDTNPLQEPELIELQPRKELWDTEAETRFLAAASPRLQLAFMLLLYTGQRLSDVLAMTIPQVSEHDGRLFIALRQQKTAELLNLAVHKTLEPYLRQRLVEKARRQAAAEASSLMLVASPRGLLWTRRNFSHDWDDVMRKAGLEGEVQRRDLRRTAVVRMAMRKMPTPLIASITGHRIDACQKIIDAYLPRRPEVALAAIEAWEAAPEPTALPAVIQLASRRRKS